MLILASASPRRRELIEKLHMPVLCEAADCEELVPEGISAEETAEYLAVLKAEAVLQKHKDEADTVVIGSDTVVVCDGEIMGKPHSVSEACGMLRKLSGRRHLVLTGVAILSASNKVHFTSRTEVEFYPLTEQEIEAYVAGGEPMDKAGAYGIQGDGALLVKRINGDYYSVMGLPLAETARRLREFLSEEA